MLSAQTKERELQIAPTCWAAGQVYFQDALFCGHQCTE